MVYRCRWKSDSSRVKLVKFSNIDFKVSTLKLMLFVTSVSYTHIFI